MVKKHCLTGLYEVSSNSGPGVQNDPAAEGFVFENKIYLEISPMLAML